MSKIIYKEEKNLKGGLVNETPVKRRSFLKYAGAGAALSALLLTGCNDDEGENSVYVKAPENFDLGSGEVAVLNYVYVLEQLEAAFYLAVTNDPGFTSTFPSELERSIIVDIRNHEIAHAEYFKGVLANVAVPDITPDFGSIKLNDRMAVLTAARNFEDVGVAAYNGAAKLLTNTTNLTQFGKIASVEGRHAAEIRDMIAPGSFADNTALDAMGMDKEMTPVEVFAVILPFLKDTITFGNLPTT